MGNKYTLIALNKRHSRNQKIKQEKIKLQNLSNQLNINQELVKMVINKTATELVELLNNNQITSQQILIIYCLRAIKVGTQFNLITEDNFNESLQAARRCDQFRKESNKKNWVIGDDWNTDVFLPPLFGIPTSVKDSIDMNGFSTTIGCVNRLTQIQSDGAILKCFRNSGMIPFVRTNISLLTLSFQSTNNLWGTSLNPWNIQRSVGGSSGGEAGLIAAKGSVIGVGSDLGGSLRIPSQFCGVFTLKPNPNRISFNGHNLYSKTLMGHNNIRPSLGPIARCVDDLAVWMKVVLCEQFYYGEHDPYVNYVPFNDKKYIDTFKNHQLRIGYIKELGFSEPTTASKRALMQTKELLENIGHELIELKVPNQQGIIRSFFGQFMAQGNLQTFKNLLKGEKWGADLKSLFQSQSLNCLNYVILTSFMKFFQPRVGFILEACKKKTVYQYTQNAGNLMQYRNIFIKYIRENNIDLIISPGFGIQACKHNLSDKTHAAQIYTFIWNALELTAGSLPITTVQQEQDVYQSKYSDIISKAISQTTKGSVGMPVGIQVIGMPYKDQQVLGLMKQIQQSIKFYEKYPLPN